MLQTNCQFAYFLQVAIACMCVYISSSLQSQLIWCDRTRCLIIIWHWCIRCPDLRPPGVVTGQELRDLTTDHASSAKFRIQEKIRGWKQSPPIWSDIFRVKKKIGYHFWSTFGSFKQPFNILTDDIGQVSALWSRLTLMARVTCVKVPSLGRGHEVSLCRERGSERLRPVVTTSGDTHYRDHGRGGACRGSPTWRWP